jgi:Centromere DNA-binding protein complex CBF3 subunit, domain 2
MDFLRTVFLQDAALLRRSYPDHEIFRDGLFSTDEFKASVCQAEDNPDWPENKNRP